MYAQASIYFDTFDVKIVHTDIAELMFSWLEGRASMAVFHQCDIVHISARPCCYLYCLMCSTMKDQSLLDSLRSN